MDWKEKIPELIMGTVLIGGAGWLITQTYSINRGLGSLEAKVDAKLTEHTTRIDKIAAALPDVRIRIAKEELSNPLTTAVVVLDPVKTSKGTWVSMLHVFDATSMSRKTYVVSAKGPNDRELALLTSGAVFEVDSEALSFTTLSGFASDAGSPISAPAYVQSKNSFVLRKPSADITRSILEVLGGRSVAQKPIPIPAGITSWSKLAAELDQNREKYQGMDRN